MKHWPLALAYLASAAAALFATAPRIAGPAVYNPMVALTALTAIALVWYTYSMRWTVEKVAEREAQTISRRRVSSCTAMLADLARVVSRLKVMTQTGAVMTDYRILAPLMLESALASPELFDPEMLHAIAATVRGVRDVQVVLDEAVRAQGLPAVGQVPVGPDIAVRADWAYRAAVSLVAILREQGGAMPPEPPAEGIAGISDPLPENPFASEPVEG
jgi:hypothetical protein